MIVLLIVLAIIVVLVIFVISLYNNLVKLRNRIENAWAQIDVQLKRRSSLIQNLVDMVREYAKHKGIGNIKVAIESGMKEKSEQFKEEGSSIYKAV